jgi:hypothetical protein
VGHFGEGLKLGLVVLCHNEYGAKIETEGERWQFTFNDSDELHNYRTMIDRNGEQKWHFKRYSIVIYRPADYDIAEVCAPRSRRPGVPGVTDSVPTRSAPYETSTSLTTC